MSRPELWIRCPNHGDLDARLEDGAGLLCPFCARSIRCPGGLVRLPFDEAMARLDAWELFKYGNDADNEDLRLVVHLENLDRLDAIFGPPAGAGGALP